MCVVAGAWLASEGRALARTNEGRALASPGSASEPAQAQDVEFKWDAPAGECPTEAEVIGEVERLLGASLAGYQGVRLTVIARVRREANGDWDLRLWTVTPERTWYRSIRDASCDLVSNAGALIAAMIIEPRAEEASDDAAVTAAAKQAEAEAKADPEPPPPLPEAVEPTSQPARADENTAAAPPSRLRVAVGALGGVALDGRPALGATAAVHTAVGGARAHAELDVVYGPPRSQPLGEGLGTFEVQSLAVGVRGCGDWRGPRLRSERWSVGACGGAEFGALVGRGVELASGRTDAVPWFALSAKVGVGLRLVSGLWLHAAPELVLPLARTRFEIDGLGAVYAPRPVGMRAAIGLRWWWGAQ